MYGWRGRIGVVLPSNNTVLEPEIYRMLPAGVSAHFSRILATGSDVDALLGMVKKADRAFTDLAAAGCDVLLYACLSTSLAKGDGWDATFCAQISKQFGIACETALGATTKALISLGVRRVCLVTPYPPEIDDLVPAALGAHGIEVVSRASMGIADITEVGRHEAWESYALAKQIFTPEVEAIVVVATDLQAAGAIAALEQDLAIPVVTTNQALVHAALQTLKVCEPVVGFGRLLNAPDVHGQSTSDGQFA